MIVTGAAGIVGSAASDRLLELGYDVVGMDMREPPQSKGMTLSLGDVDLADEDNTRDAFEAVSSRFDVIHGLVNAAGGFSWETIGGGSIATWDRLYTLNVMTALNACRAAMEIIPSGGAIVNIGAAGAQKADLGMAAYAASKSGVARLTEGLAAELKERGVRVNALLPSIIDTPTNRIDMADADFSRWVSPGALADVIAFLLSHESSAITGALIPVAGRV